MRSNSLVPIVALACALVAVPAHADDSETFFAQGRSLRAARNCADAIVAFRRAFELKPLGLGSLRNVAECEEELGQFASARADWWSLRRAVLQSNEPKYEHWDKDAEQAYNRLEPKVARITIKLEGVSPERAKISVDGKPLDPRLVGVELERDLGSHTIEAFYGAATPLADKRTLVAGAREIVTFTIPAPKPGEGAPSGGPDAGADAGRPLRVAGIVALAVGGVGIVGLAASAAIRASALSAFSPCAPSYTNCPTSLQGDYTKGQTASTLVTVFSVVAGAGVLAGVPLVIVGSRKSEPASSPARPAAVWLVPSPYGAAVGAGWRF